ELVFRPCKRGLFLRSMRRPVKEKKRARRGIDRPPARPHNGPLVIERIGNCRILEEIGSGGMAVIYKAVQESLNRTVAIKALKTSVAKESQFAIRFEREALSIAALQHENIIHIYDFQKIGGALFIVMEYVEGIDL